MELEHPADNEASTAERLIGGGGAAGVKERARAVNSTGAFHASKCRFYFFIFLFFYTHPSPDAKRVRLGVF